MMFRSMEFSHITKAFLHQVVSYLAQRTTLDVRPECIFNISHERNWLVHSLACWSTSLLLDACALLHHVVSAFFLNIVFVAGLGLLVVCDSLNLVQSRLGDKLVLVAACVSLSFVFCDSLRSGPKKSGWQALIDMLHSDVPSGWTGAKGLAFRDRARLRDLNMLYKCLVGCQYRLLNAGHANLELWENFSKA